MLSALLQPDMMQKSCWTWKEITTPTERKDIFKAYTFGQNSSDLGPLHPFAHYLPAYLIFKMQFQCCTNPSLYLV